MRRYRNTERKVWNLAKFQVVQRREKIGINRRKRKVTGLEETKRKVISQCHVSLIDACVAAVFAIQQWSLAFRMDRLVLWLRKGRPQRCHASTGKVGGFVVHHRLLCSYSNTALSGGVAEAERTKMIHLRGRGEFACRTQVSVVVCIQWSESSRWLGGGGGVKHKTNVLRF